MSPARALFTSALLLLGGACACSGRSSRPGAEAIVAGTVLDAASGAAVAEVPLEGPQGAHATSGRDGRFEMSGLREGDSGEVRARASDGRTGSVTLRPLRPGRLEVVVNLYRR
jgi:hypothetical protein